MPLALFDLDNTLLSGDSDYAWGRFLIEQGVVDGKHYERENERFYREYRQGTLDIREFLRFQLRPLADHPVEQLHRWRSEFLEGHIEPMLLPAARRLVDEHRRQGHTLIIITATNRFITAPIAERFHIEHLLATEPEWDGARYTGEVSGTPCYREGKVARLQQWLEQHGADLEHSHFYSDSHNDLPLLQEVAHPVAVDPDAELDSQARKRGWPVISLRQASGPVAIGD